MGDATLQQIEDVTETRSSSHLAAKELLSLASSFRGPCPALKFIQPSSTASEFVLTTISGRLLSNLNLPSPVARVAIDTIKAFIDSSGDSGLLSVMLLTHLLCVEDSRECCHHSVWSAALRTAMEWCEEYITSPHCPCTLQFSWENTRIPMALVESMLTPKLAVFLSSLEIKHLAVMTMKAFVSIVGCEGPGINLSLVRMHTAKDTVLNSQVVNGALLKIPIPPEFSDGSMRGDLIVAVYGASLEFTATGFHDVEIKGFGQNEGHWRARFAIWKSLVRKMVDAGVNVVACQKGIHPVLADMLLSESILPLDRLSMRHIDTVLSLTRARLLAGYEDILSRDVLGKLSSLEVYSIGRDKFLWMRPPEHSPSFVTMLLCAPDDILSSEIQFIITNALKMLRVVLRSPIACAGGGCTEIHLASILRQKLSALQASPRRGSWLNSTEKRVFGSIIASAADALDMAACSYQKNGDSSSREMVLSRNVDTLLMNDSTSGERLVEVYGWSPSCEQSIPVLSYLQANGRRELIEANVVDAVQTKIDAVNIALESAITLHRVGATVIDKR